MQHDVIALGSTFSEWADLTEEYAKGMEGLRRREPGASTRMMEIAKLMSRYQQLMGSSDAPSQPAAVAAAAPKSPSVATGREVPKSRPPLVPQRRTLAR